MLSTMRFPGAAMKISDLLSPADVMFDVRVPNKHLLLQELRPRQQAVWAWVWIKWRRTFSSGRNLDRQE